MTRKIVVGVDGSEGAARALAWAVDEARAHHAEVTALLAWSLLDQAHTPEHPAFDPAYGESDALDALARYVKEAVGEEPLSLRAVCDLPADALVDAAATADLVVVGARGLGGFESLLLGSVSERVLERASVPVAVVRGHVTRGGVVVVGVDGSSTSADALRWAAAEAAARDVELHVVHSWHSPYTPDVAPSTFQLVEQAAEAILTEATSDPALDGLTVRAHLRHGNAVATLCELASGASAVVVGSRGRSRLASALLGSTSRQLAHHAPCPVVVVPGDRS